MSTNLELVWDRNEERFTLTCFDDDTCRKIGESSENIREIWGSLNSIHPYGNVSEYV